MNVQDVKNWRMVGVLLLGYGSTKLKAVERKYSSSGDRVRAVVQQWLEGRGSPWRRLVWVLDYADDIQVADPIRGFTEPQRGKSS